MGGAINVSLRRGSLGLLMLFHHKIVKCLVSAEVGIAMQYVPCIEMVYFQTCI